MLLFAAVGIGSSVSLAAPGPGIPELTTVAEIRALTATQARESSPIHLHGVVTVLSGWKSSFFLQDKTAGISIDRQDSAPELHPGDEVDVIGVTGPGHFAPVVLAKAVKVLGKGKLPQTRIFTPIELAGGSQDSQYLAIQGIVRTISIQPLWGRQFLILTVDTGSNTMVTARVHDFPASGFESLSGATVIIHGVCGTVFNDKRQFVGPRMFVANLNDILVEHLAPPPFELPVRALDSLLQFDQRSGAINRVRVRGIVTDIRAGEGFYLQDGSEGVFVQSIQPLLQVHIGSWVDAVGYPAVGHYSPKLEDSVFRVESGTGNVAPLARTAAGMITTTDGFTSAPYDSVLVQVQGRLIEEIPSGTEDLLIFRDGSTVFTAHVSQPGAGHPRIAPGTLLSITGICVAIADEAHELRAFELQLRSRSDLTVLEKAPWWTAAHAEWIVGILLVIMLAMIGWLTVVRRQANLRALAVADPLTGLYNRRGFMLLAEQQWQLALRGRVPLLLFYIDVDHFKQINDSYGHKEGDAALKIVADVLRECFRKSDILGRIGGDEFAVAAVDANSAALSTLEQRIFTTVEQANQNADHGYQLSLSVGTLVCDDSHEVASIEDLLSKADARMYEQKKSHHLKA